MQTEMKTLVYRDREDNEKKKSTKVTSKMFKIRIMVAALITTIAISGVIIGTSVGRSSAAEIELPVQNSAELAAVAGRLTADYNTCDSNSVNQTPGDTSVSASVNAMSALAEATQLASLDAPTITLGLNNGIEENIMMMLLSEVAEDEYDYFPVNLGAEGTEEKNSELAEEDSSSTTRLDEIEEMLELAEAPEGTPSGLSYKYNSAMQLELTKDEIVILERIVEAEATDQDVYGRMLVANVVINRVHSKYFANSVQGVVFETIGGSPQFSPIKDGRYYSVTVTDLTKEAVSRVLAGEDYSNGALYFFQRSATTANKATWFDKNLKYLFKYGCHEFYTEYKAR